MSEFREVRFRLDLGPEVGEPRFLSYCIRLPAGASRARALKAHVDALGISPFVENLEVIKQRALRGEKERRLHAMRYGLA